MESTTYISFAVLHGTLFVPGVGQFGPTLTTEAAADKAKGVKMVLEGSFLKAQIKGTDILIPLTNISHMIAVKQS